MGDGQWHFSCIATLSEELGDPTNPLTSALLRCGQPICDDLRSNAQNLVAGNDVESSCAKLESLIETAHKNITTLLTGHSLTGWIRLYADASILRSLAGIGPPTATESIARLDKVIITCGPASGRLDLITAVIKLIQYSYLPVPYAPSFTTSSRSGCPKNRQTPTLLGSSHSSTPIFPEPPSLHSFQSALHGQPFIISRYAQHWPAMVEHPWRSAAYLRSVAGPGRIVPVEVGGDYRDHEWTQKLMNWEDFLASLHLADQPSPPEHANTIYLAQHNLFLQFPSLQADVIVPDYVYASMDTPDFTGYKPPGNDEQLVINMWLGPKGTISPAHTDPYYNLFVQVVGRKTVWLAPSQVTASMYPYSSNEDFHNSAANSTEPSMTNTSRVDVFSAQREEFRDFWTQVVPKATSAMLEPGDLLYIPPGWWHAMRSEETSFSVSMWF